MCKYSDNPRASPTTSVTNVSCPQAASRFGPLAPSPDASLGTLTPHRQQTLHLPGPASPGVDSLAAIRRLVNKWARETLSEPELPRASATVGTDPGYILAGTVGTQLWDGQFVWP